MREEPKSKATAAVWILNPDDEDFIQYVGDKEPFEIGSVRVYRPRHLTPRIIAQSGVFTVHPLSANSFDPCSVPRYLPVEEASRIAEGLTKIEIPHASFSDLRDNLERHGVSDLTMFPDLEGVARYIKWNNTFMKDESCPDEVLLKQI